MTGTLMLEGVAHGERSAAIVAIRDAIGEAGCLLDARAFSDVAMSFHCELEVDRVGSFEAALRSADVLLADTSLAALLAAARTDRAGRPLVAMLHVTFRGGHGELRTEVPDVPG